MTNLKCKILRKIRKDFELETGIKIHKNDPASEQALYIWMGAIEEGHVLKNEIATFFPEHFHNNIDLNRKHRIDAACQIYEHLSRNIPIKEEDGSIRILKV